MENGEVTTIGRRHFHQTPKVEDEDDMRRALMGVALASHETVPGDDKSPEATRKYRDLVYICAGRHLMRSS